MGKFCIVYDSIGGSIGGSRDQKASNAIILSNLEEKSVYQQGLKDLVTNIVGNLGKMVI